MNDVAVDPDPEAVEALAELDEATERVAVAIEKCGQLANEGKLDGNTVMLKFHQLSARLMAGPQNVDPTGEQVREIPADDEFGAGPE